MIQEEFAVSEPIAQIIIDLQTEHDLPLDIIVGIQTKSLVQLTIEGKYREDHHLISWLLERATNHKQREEGMEEDDEE